MAMSERINLRGKRFDRLCVIRDAGNYVSNGRVRALWHCRCSCGALVVVRSSSLRSGATKSCGCRRRDANKRRGSKC